MPGAGKAYRPETNSFSSGQVLQEPYTFKKARVVIQEMAEGMALDLVSKRLVTDQLVLTVGYDSENLTYWAIHDVIQEMGLSHFGISIHYPLRLLITPASDLTPEQRDYASRSWTHVDFLVYDTVPHKARLAIEVDGTQYHKKGSDQGHRDSLKDSVLAAIGLPLLRLSTMGSQEKEKIWLALKGEGYSTPA